MQSRDSRNFSIYKKKFEIAPEYSIDEAYIHSLLFKRKSDCILEYSNRPAYDRITETLYHRNAFLTPDTFFPYGVLKKD